MNWRRTSRLRDWLLPLTTVAGVALVLILAARPHSEDVQPPDCSLSPVAYHPGTLLRWKISVNRGGENAELSALVQLDDGREITAYNATNEALRVNDRVMVSEIVCIHRRVHLLTEFPAPEGTAVLDRQ
jgi:hypothetical protein